MTTQFQQYRDGVVEYIKSNSTNSADAVTARQVFDMTHNFLTTNQLASSDTRVGMETLNNIPTLVHNSSNAYDFSMEAISDFVTNCKVPEDTRTECAIEIARILSGANTDAHAFYDKGRAKPGAIAMESIYGSQSIALINGQARAAIESFGEFTDRVTSDSRLSIALTVLRAHKSLIDRILPRVAVEDPVVLIKIPMPEVYNLAQSQNPVASVRYSSRQPLITLYRVPDFVNTQPQQIVALAANDTGTPALTYNSTNGILNTGVKANLFDLTLQANTVGFTAVDWTDLVSDGGAVSQVIVRVTKNVSGTITTEDFPVATQYYRGANFTTLTNTTDSAERGANLRFKTNLTAGSTLVNGSASSILSTFTGVNVLLDVNFNAVLNLKTSYIEGNGAITPSINTTLVGGVPAGVQTIYGELSFAVVAYTPYVFFNEENMRKTNTGVRLSYKEQEFLIPVGKNFVTDYSLQGQNVGDDVVNSTNSVMGIGNSARSINIITNTLTAVNARLQYENSNPDLDYYSLVAQDYAAGNLSLPHVGVLTLNVAGAAVMREAERLSDLHSYVTARLTAIIADGHNKSMYTENFEAGERARYKLITSGVIAETLLGISQYWNTLDDKVAVAANSDYSFKLPNGTQIDVIKSNFESFEGIALLIPVRDAKPDDVTSFGKILDRGTFVGQYTPVQNGAANRRIVANSREIVFPTNPLGYVLTIAGINTELSVLVDGPGLSE